MKTLVKPVKPLQLLPSSYENNINSIQLAKPAASVENISETTSEISETKAKPINDNTTKKPPLATENISEISEITTAFAFII